jgi:hypothetical protein
MCLRDDVEVAGGSWVANEVLGAVVLTAVLRAPEEAIGGIECSGRRSSL